MLLQVLLFSLLTLKVISKPLDDEPSCGYAACPTRDPDAVNVHIVPHSHDDVGWEKTFDQYYFQDVQTLISSVVIALKQNPERRFIQVETAFFKKWWEVQKNSVKQDVIDLVNNGQFEIINGGWSMNDEAGVNYQSTIDQYTIGLRYLEDRLGKCSRPKVGWQIDSFGHSREQASISAQLGFDSMFFARLDYRDRETRMQAKTGDLLWRGSASLGNASDIFTSVLYKHYSAPSGFCFDIKCNDEPIIDDEESPDYNYQRRVEEFANYVREQASKYPTNNILVTMGDDFRYQAALASYINTDRLIKYNAFTIFLDRGKPWKSSNLVGSQPLGFDLFPQDMDGKPIKLFYSTPTCYTKAVNDYVLANDYKLKMKNDDFFPYGDNVDALVVGYFTSRPASKRFVFDGNNLLQAAKQLAAVANEPYENADINSLKEAMGVMQHHDAITGTELIDVTHDYHRLLHKAMIDTNSAVNTMLSNLISGSPETDFQFKSCLLANVSFCPETKSDQFVLTVYNPLSRVVSSPISVPVDTENWKIVDPDGKEVTHQVDPTFVDFSQLVSEEVSPLSLVFWAQDLPALGYKIYTFTKTATVKPKKPAPRSVVIGNGDTSFELDETSGLIISVNMNGATVNLTQAFYHYKSGYSQAWVFTPQDNAPATIVSSTPKIDFIVGDVYVGIVQEFSDWVKQVVKVYTEDSSYIEFDWIVGPLDISDGGKEVITRFTTTLVNNGFFYTDSNGREMLKRERNARPDYEYTNEKPISGNYYPITSKAVIRDEELGLEIAVLNDRCQGGSSINDGEIEMMVHRRISTTDQFGLDEFEYDHPIVVRGKHYLVAGKTEGNGEKSLAAIQRDVAQRKVLQPWLFFTNQDISEQLKNKQFSNLKSELPENIQILTLEPWKDDVILLRLEHILEKNEDATLSKEATVDLSDLFVAFTINELQETTLAGNIPLEENERLQWPGSENDVEFPKQDVSDLTVTLIPMQIRTFLAKVTYN